MLLVFFAGSFYFYWTLYEQERGTRKRDEVERYSSRPAREYRTEGREQASSVREPYTCLEETE